jgi:hypothetical protein
MCPSGSKFLPSDCCFIDLALKNQTHTDGLVQSGHHHHRLIDEASSRNDIAEKLLSKQ